MLKYRDTIENFLLESTENIKENINENIKEIDDNADLSLYGMNSIEAIQLIVAIENEFNIEIDDEDLMIENINSVCKINDLIIKYLG